MGFREARIWRTGVFNWLREAFSSEKRVVRCLRISENGVNSLVSIRLATGYCLSSAEKLAWCVIQKLKLPMEGVDEPVLPISERSYMPLDPLGLLTDEEKKALEPLKNVARARHAEERSRVSDDNRWGFVIIICLFGIVFVLRSC
jgi:hypothetical protein